MINYFILYTDKTQLKILKCMVFKICGWMEWWVHTMTFLGIVYQIFHKNNSNSHCVSKTNMNVLFIVLKIHFTAGNNICIVCILYYNIILGIYYIKVYY